MNQTIAIIILSFNEELNISKSILSAKKLSKSIYVIDSLSSDSTVSIAKDLGCIVIQNKFENFSTQRNFALKNVPDDFEWIMFLDADEWLTPQLVQEIKVILRKNQNVNGYLIKRKLIWFGTWIKRGYYPSWQLRLFRKKFVFCENRSVNEHFVVNGKISKLKYDFVDENSNGLQAWLIKHIDYARREAVLANTKINKLENKIPLVSQAGQRRFLREKVYNKLPLFIRPILYFLFRIIVKGGILDGKNAILFHFLQALWYPMLIDIFLLEMRLKNKFK